MAETQAVFKHILVPTDGSQPSVTAGRLAVQLAASQRAHITFVYVVDADIVKKITGASNKTPAQIEHELERAGQHYLSYLTRLAANAGLTSDRIIRHGVPYNEIEGLAREQGIDLIVIACVGQHGPRRILIGGVTERVIEYAPCPVLVVK